MFEKKVEEATFGMVQNSFSPNLEKKFPCYRSFTHITAVFPYKVMV